jgi:hypothetical protein
MMRPGTWTLILSDLMARQDYLKRDDRSGDKASTMTKHTMLLIDLQGFDQRETKGAVNLLKSKLQARRIL